MTIQLDLQIERLFKLNEQGKGPFLRQTKHFEETSELADAIVENAPVAAQLGEAIDGLLMILSIGADYVSETEFPIMFNSAVNDSFAWDFNVAQGDFETGILHECIAYNCLKYIGSLQHISTAVQQHEGVASSQYKGKAGLNQIVTALCASTAKLMTLIAYIAVEDPTMIQTIYNEKMDKWEKVSK